MNARTPLVLVLIASILLAYVLLFERGRPGRKEIESRAGFLLQRLVPERITRFRVAAGDERLVLQRHGEGFDETWTIVEPRKAPADPELVANYLRNWEFAIPVRTLQTPNAEDLRSFGIETPEAEVTFEMGQVTTRIWLGSGVPVDGGGYVRIDESRPVTVVGKDVVELFDATVEDFELKGDAGAPFLSDLLDAGDDRAAEAP